MTKPHVHAECIKAWADGAIIQYYDKQKVAWVDVPDNCPTWYFGEKYRVKPEPDPDLNFNVRVSTCKYGTGIPTFDLWNCVDATSGNNLMLVFDGETGILKVAQVLAHV
jgi:hypothetical protein